MKLPSLTGIGSMGAVTTQNISLRVGPCASGDLLILMAGKRVSSNFTFPAAFTKTEVATGGLTSAIAWKWGALADSGSTAVMSTSAAGNLLHAVSLAIKDVRSDANPLEGLQTEVWSRNYSRAGSLNPVGQALGVCCIVGFDNVAVNAGGFTANSWSIANSHTTSTGSDGQMASFIREFLLANSGAFFNPNSSAGTAPRHARTFFVRGVPEVTEATRESAFELTDGFLRGAQVFMKIASDAFFALDSEAKRMAFAVLFNEGLVVSDSLIEDVVAGGTGGTVYTETLTSTTALIDAAIRMVRRVRLADDALTLTDAGWSGKFVAALVNDLISMDDSLVKAIVGGGIIETRTATSSAVITDALVRAWQQIRMLGDAFTVTDEVRLTRMVNRTVADALAPSDEVLRRLLRLRLATDALTLADYETARLTLRRLRDDSLTLSDSLALHRRLTRRTDDAVTFADSVLRQGSSSKVLNDSVSLQDGALAYARKSRLATDVAVVIDELRASRKHGRVASDTLSLDDKRAMLLFLNRADLIVPSDSSVQTRRLRRALMDAVTLTDFINALVAGKAVTRTSSDLIEMLDEVRMTRRFGRVASDLLTLDEKRTFLLFLNRADAITLADSALVTRLLIRALQDAITLSDPVISLVTTGVRVRVAGDTIMIDDGVQRVTMRRRIVGDTITLTDFAVAATAGLRVRTLDDAMTVSDGKVSGAVRNRLVQDLVAALNDQAVRGTVRWRLLADALSPADFSMKMLARTLLLSSEATLDDGALQARISVRALYDILEITDDFTKTIADALVNLLDVRIMIGAALFAPVVGSHSLVAIGAATLAALGSHSITFIGADAGPTLGGYN